jgi:predicted O-methyltransferase YrrM
VPPLVWLFAPLFYYAARTGVGMTLCRKWGFEPMRVHYYQPLPEYEHLSDTFFNTPQDLPGITIDRHHIQATLTRLSVYASECQWQEYATHEGEYYAQNSAFGYSSAALLHTMIRAHKTRRVVEIGSGFSTLISLAALRMNGDFTLTCIEPYPKTWLRQLPIDLRITKAEAVDLSVYTLLDAGDVLFIDSSHVAKLNSDVNFLVMRVLPRLKSGVIVHIHDIYIPYEYPRVHFTNKPSYYWNEQYVLQAFLSGNPHFEILMPGYYAQTEMQAAFKNAFAGYNPAVHRATSSFWLRRK